MDRDKLGRLLPAIAILLALAAEASYVILGGGSIPFIGPGVSDPPAHDYPGEGMVSYNGTLPFKPVWVRDDPLGGDNFTIVVIPDSQHYSEDMPEIFINQTRWIASRRLPMNIVFAIHEGDIVNKDDSRKQWDAANRAFAELDGVVPYSVLAGNHDLGSHSLYDEYFPASRFKGQPWFGGASEGNRGTYQLFSAGGSDFISVSLGFCPNAQDIAWGSDVLSHYQRRHAILVTHGFLNEHAQRSVYGCQETSYLWDGIVVPNPNVFLILNGHTHAEARRTDEVNGRRVHQLLADYQGWENGGDGFLRLLEFAPSEGRIYVKTFSPWLRLYKADDASQFVLDYAPKSAFFKPHGE